MRRIKHACVKSLALCKRGKNGLATLFKSDGTMELTTLVKGDAEKGELLAVAYPKGLVDADGDFADTIEAIESMAHSFLREGAQLDIEHDGKTLSKSQAFVKESFIVQPGDQRFAQWPGSDGKPVDVTGGWAVLLQIDDPVLRKAYRDGEWDGISLFGPAAVEEVDLKAASQRVAARMGGMQEIDMTKEELEAILAAQDAKTVALVKSAVTEAVAALAPKAEPKPEAKAEQKPDSVPPTFTGDPLNAEDLATYETALRRHELQKAIQSGTMSADQLATMRKSLTESLPSDEELSEAGIKVSDEDSPEYRAMAVKLFKARKGSNAPARGQRDEVAELAKAQEDEGLELAKLINESFGASQGMRVVQG